MMLVDDLSINMVNVQSYIKQPKGISYRLDSQQVLDSKF